MKNQRTISYSAKKIFTVILSAIALSFLMYSFAIASTTVTISDAQLMNHNIQELHTEIAGLESEYYTMINELSIEQATKEGFVEDADVAFAYVESSNYVAYNN